MDANRQDASTGALEPVRQFRKQFCADWYDGIPDSDDVGVTYETRTLYAAPPNTAAIIAKLTQERESFYKVAMERNEQFVQTCAEVECLNAELDNIKQVEFTRRVEKVIEGWLKKCDRLTAELADAIDVKNGNGPTALSMVTADRDALRAELASASERIAALEQDAAQLIDVATGRIKHDFMGMCPDRIVGPDARDPDCPACRVLIDAARNEAQP